MTLSPPPPSSEWPLHFHFLPPPLAPPSSTFGGPREAVSRFALEVAGLPAAVATSNLKPRSLPPPGCLPFHCSLLLSYLSLSFCSNVVNLIFLIGLDLISSVLPHSLCLAQCSRFVIARSLLTRWCPVAVRLENRKIVIPLRASFAFVKSVSFSSLHSLTGLSFPSRRPGIALALSYKYGHGWMFPTLLYTG